MIYYLKWRGHHSLDQAQRERLPNALAKNSEGDGGMSCRRVRTFTKRRDVAARATFVALTGNGLGLLPHHWHGLNRSVSDVP